MLHKVVLIKMELEKMVLVATVLEDGVFGGVRRLGNVIMGEGWEMWVEESELDRMEVVKKGLLRQVCVDEEEDRREIVVEDLNVIRGNRVMLVADLVMELGERGWVRWEIILSSCWSWTVFLAKWGKVRFFVRL